MRFALIYIALFLLPFTLYAGWLMVRRENPFSGRSWRVKDMAWLGLAGLALITFFYITGSYSGAQLSGRNGSHETMAP